jgi:hypothetical protein
LKMDENLKVDVFLGAPDPAVPGSAGSRADKAETLTDSSRFAGHGD